MTTGIPKPIEAMLLEEQLISNQTIADQLTRDPDLRLRRSRLADEQQVVPPPEGTVELQVIVAAHRPLSGLPISRFDRTARQPVTVLVTVNRTLALEAIVAGVSGCLLSPYQHNDVISVVTRAKQEVWKRNATAVKADLPRQTHSNGGPEPARAPVEEPRNQRTPGAAGRGVQRIAVNAGRKIIYVSADDVDWVAAEDNYVRLHALGRTHLIRETLGSFKRRLNPSLFFRVHRSFVVNLDRVRELHPVFGGEAVVVLSDGKRLPISKNRLQEFKRCMQTIS